jgi:biotin synthase
MVLGLEGGNPPEHFTTAFIMTYHEEGCDANCAFCPQASSSDSDPKLLSRIGWPKFSFDDVVGSLVNSKKVSRICIQTLNYENVVQDVINIVGKIREYVQSPISVCIHPINKDDMIGMNEAGVNNIGIAIDACTQSLFDNIKGSGRNGPYTWSGHIDAIQQAQLIFGFGHVTTHLIVGLGETEKQAAEFLLKMKEMRVRVGLFAFTNIKGTSLENIPQPELGVYRRIQILRDLLTRNKITNEQIAYDENGRLKFLVDTIILRESLSSGSAFRVTGCPGCNRPYYNERPRGPMYNFPRPLREEEIVQALTEAGLVD